MPLYGADSFLGWMDNVRRVAAKNVKDLVEDPGNALSKTLHASVDTIDQTMRDPMNFVGAGIAGAIVGHASPYKFSKFDSSKLKTGQGAMSYGAGTYFAEHPAVIKEYEREMLGKKASAIGSIDAQLSVYRTIFKDKTLDVKDRSIALERIKHYEAEKAALEKHYTPTSYKVDLPDEQIAKMLDWDKPLTQLPKKDREVLSLVAEQEGLPVNYRGSNILAGERKGEDFYNALVEKLGDEKQASAILNSYGIPGIKYLDQRSRGVGEGTSNFVVFEPELLKILESEVIK